MINLQAKKRVEEYMDELVDKAKELVEETKIYDPMDPSQLRNLLNLVSDTESVKVIELFIQYQMGRNREVWTHAGFGDLLLEEIKVLEGIAKEIDVNFSKAIWIELVRLFIGYLNRYFVYMRNIKKEGES